jgi:hypothetical protein
VGQSDALREHGADTVVSDLADLADVAEPPAAAPTGAGAHKPEDRT